MQSVCFFMSLRSGSYYRNHDVMFCLVSQTSCSTYQLVTNFLYHHNSFACLRVFTGVLEASASHFLNNDRCRGPRDTRCPKSCGCCELGCSCEDCFFRCGNAIEDRPQGSSSTVSLDSRFLTFTMDKFLNDMEREKPVQFTSQHLRIATENFTAFLGAGGFGSVYKGIFCDGTMEVVKVLHGNSDKRTAEQFMAEVSTVGIVHHPNLVRLHGFCFEKQLRALVYEYMGNGSLDKYLFHGNKILGFEKLHEIAVGTARGIAYLHEECQQ